MFRLQTQNLRESVGVVVVGVVRHEERASEARSIFTPKDEIVTTRKSFH